MGRRYDTVSFLTDYGLTDEFVGVVKAVLRDLAPHATVVDLTHGIAPFDVRAGSLTLARAISYVPEGVVLAVVDPGVATERKAVAIEVAGGAGVVVGPDNGLLAPAVAVVGGASRAVELTNPYYQLPAPGATFAGRDVFAPAAAHLCNGVDLAELGPPIDPALLIPGMVPLPRPTDEGLHADVLWVDRFGNCELNVGPDDLELDPDGDPVVVIVGDDRHVAHPTRSFAELGPGSLGLLRDAYGMFALVLDQRSAASELHLAAGDQVLIAPAGEGPPMAPVTPVELRPGR